MEDKKSLSIAEAVCTGIFLYFILAWIGGPRGLPLIDFYPNTIMRIIHPLLSVVILILVFFQKKYFKTYVLLMALSLTITTVFNYSTNYAFRYFTPFIFLFAFIFDGKSLREKRGAAQLIIGCLFLFSAFHKMNPAYLSGVEFTRNGTFMAFYQGWFRGAVPETLPEFLTYLPHISIVMELIIALGVIIRPALFAHIAAFFLLFLSFINPPVLNVFFLHLPFFIIMDKRLNDFLVKLNYRNILSLPYFWGGLIFISTTHLRTLTDAWSRTWIVSVMMIIMHILVIIKKNEVSEGSEFRKTTAWLLPAGMLFLFLGSYRFLPSPIGFKMFSGKKFQIPFYELSISDHATCNNVSRTWFFTRVTDSGFRRTQPQGCMIFMPTRSGLSYARRMLCKRNPTLQFSLKKSDETIVTPLTCADS